VRKRRLVGESLFMQSRQLTQASRLCLKTFGETLNKSRFLTKKVSRTKEKGRGRFYPVKKFFAQKTRGVAGKWAQNVCSPRKRQPQVMRLMLTFFALLAFPNWIPDICQWFCPSPNVSKPEF